MFLNRNFYNALMEVGPAVVSNDLNDRLRGYLDNDELLKDLGALLKTKGDGEFEITDLDKTKYGIQEQDRLFVKVEHLDEKHPRFFMWILNDEFIWGDLDMDAAAAILKSGGEGTSFAEKGIIGSIGSFFSGGGEDAGTDEETIAAVAGAFANIAAAKSLDPKIYFDKLDEVFRSKYGTNITTFLDNEFSGYSEIVSMNTFRRKIEPSTLRGLNIWTILGDVALTLATFGGSVSFTAALKGSRVANAASKVSKAAKATKVGSALNKGVTAVADITRLSKLFNKLDKAKKIKALEKAGVNAGSTVKYMHKGSLVDHKILAITDNGVQLERIATTGPKAPFTVGFDKYLQDLSPSTSTKILDGAGINLTAGAVLAAKKSEEVNGSMNPAEIMGYYDSLAADPNAYLENAKNQGAADIASMLYDLKNGSGLFGNTTDQEECSIALLITGLTPEMARQVNTEYSKVDSKASVYDVIDDELGGDISIFAKAYWTGCTGEGDAFKAAIENVISKIKKK